MVGGSGVKSRVDAIRKVARGGIESWSRHVLGLPLYKYQLGIAEAIVRATLTRDVETVAVEMPRQSGKNEISAQVESLLLARLARKDARMVKAAPTWTPQLVNSKDRLLAHVRTIRQRMPWLKYYWSMGYIVVCGSAKLQFLSAKPTSSVVGATANMLMEIDEAQDVLPEKYNKDFSPMRASTGAVAAFYGTTWSDETLLERVKQSINNGSIPGLVFRISPEQVIDENPAYGVFLEREVARLGRDHPLVKTQYFLEPLPTSGRMLSDQQLRSIIGEHARQEKRNDEEYIVAGLDFAGADEAMGILNTSNMNASARDSVALTIARAWVEEIVVGLKVLHVEMLDRFEWVNINPVQLHAQLYEILYRRWRVDKVHCDSTGIGEASTHFLAGAMNSVYEKRVEGIKFTGTWTAQSRMAFNYLMLINQGTLRDYKPESDLDILQIARQEAPPANNPTAHTWWQRGHARLKARTNRRVSADVPEEEGHDDLLMSELLCVDAAVSLLISEDEPTEAGVI